MGAQISSALHTGGRQLMEDAAFLQAGVTSKGEAFLVAVLSDGHQNRGETAAAGADIACASCEIYSDLLCQEARQAPLEDAFVDAFALTHKELERCFQGKRAGACLTAYLLDLENGRIWCGNLGDSLTTVWERTVDAAGLERLEPVSSLVMHRAANPAEATRIQSTRHPADPNRLAQIHNNRLEGALAVTSAFGHYGTDIDWCLGREPSCECIEPAQPVNGGYAILASDGLWDFVTVDDLGNLLHTLPLSAVPRAAIELVKQRAGNDPLDNLSIVCVEWDMLSAN